MKNLKNFAFGLLVAAFALGFSAFTSVQNTRVPQWVYVQTDANEYTKVAFSSYDPLNCEDISTSECSFTQPENDTQDHGEVITRTDAINLDMIPSESEGLYNP